MVKLPDGFCIDSTEVTRDQYQAWLDTSPNPAITPQHEFCESNTSFERDAECAGYDSVCQGDNCGQHPITCVDWCDAQAYCYAAGKRLCGHLEGGGVRGDDLRGADQRAQGQWYTACLNGGARVGSQYCNFGTNTTVPVASLSECQTTTVGYEGVFDLSANVWERVDECETQVNGVVNCLARGGAFNSYYASCTHDVVTLVDTARGHIGFRCCAP